MIAWLWARTVRCPNPVCGATMPLASSFWLSKKKDKKAWIEPVVDRGAREVCLKVRTGRPDAATSKAIDTGSGFVDANDRRARATFRCVVCESGVSKGAYIDNEANSGRMGATPLALVAESHRNRVYLPFEGDQQQVALQETQQYLDSSNLAEKAPLQPARGTFASNAQGRIYGFKTFADYFGSRQLVALTTFSDLVSEAKGKVCEDALAAGLADDGRPLSYGGKGARSYADAVATYLTFGLSKATNRNCTLALWETGMDRLAGAFGRQGLSMRWAFAETNPLSGAGGDIAGTVASVAEVLDNLGYAIQGYAEQRDAVSLSTEVPAMISTDPPYYDNVSYADLSDFFYVWLRRSLSGIYPSIFSTVLVPKSAELIATPYRFGGSKQRAREYFEEGLGEAFEKMRKSADTTYPITVFYAYKQSEYRSDLNGAAAVVSTGWETMLEGLLATGFQITGTWPMRTELTSALKKEVGALASSIVLVCRPRPTETPPATRQEFVRALRRELPDALSVMMAENVAPVDLAQATIGPGMAVYSRYSKVVEADGSPMRIRTALQIINQSLDEYLTEAQGEVDSHTRFVFTWFEQRGMEAGPYGEAETIATARGVSVRGVQEAGIRETRAGKVRLLPRERLLEGWDPQSDGRVTGWEVVQYLIRALETEGEQGAAMLLARIGEKGEVARDLAYRLYGICERKGWAEEALAYNALVVAWPEITRLVSQNPGGTEPQTTMDF